MNEPEFNNGFLTALALFCMHYNHLRDVIYVASDHLLDMEIPENLDPAIAKKVKQFKRKVMSRRLAEKIPEEEIKEIFKECVDIFKLIDEKYFGLEVTINYY